MAIQSLEAGVVISVDPTNVPTMGMVDADGRIDSSKVQKLRAPLSHEPDNFYGALADLVLKGRSAGATYGVIGVHGMLAEHSNPARRSGQYFLGTPHIKLDGQSSPLNEMSRHKPLHDSLRQGFILRFTTNDLLVAHAAARAVQPRAFDVVAGVDLTSHVTGGVLVRDERGSLQASNWGLDQTHSRPQMPRRHVAAICDAISELHHAYPRLLEGIPNPSDTELQDFGERVALVLARLGKYTVAQSVVVSGVTDTSVRRILTPIIQKGVEKSDVPNLRVNFPRHPFHRLRGGQRVMISHLVSGLEIGQKKQPGRITEPGTWMPSLYRAVALRQLRGSL